MIWRRFSTRHAWRISMVVGVLAAVLFAGGTVAAQEEFRRADVNQDSTFDLADAAHGLNYLLGFSDLSCPDAADVNDDGAVDLSDMVHLLLWLFVEDALIIAQPFPSCGADLTPDALPCLGSVGCP